MSRENINIDVGAYQVKGVLERIILVLLEEKEPRGNCHMKGTSIPVTFLWEPPPPPPLHPPIHPGIGVHRTDGNHVLLGLLFTVRYD